MTANLLDSNFWSAVIGSIVGAVLGGMIALAAQALERRAAVRDRKEEDHRRRLVLGLTALTKLKQMHRHLVGLVGYLEMCRQSRSELEPWAWIEPLSAMPKAVAFSVDELANLLTLDHTLYNDLVEFSDTYDVALGTYLSVVSERQKILDKISPQSVEGLDVQIDVDDAQFMSTAAIRAGLNDLIPRMCHQNRVDEQAARDLLARTVSVLNAKLEANLVGEFRQFGAEGGSSRAESAV